MFSAERLLVCGRCRMIRESGMKCRRPGRPHTEERSLLAGAAGSFPDAGPCEMVPGTLFFAASSLEGAWG